jgi:hypothetical protein
MGWQYVQTRTGGLGFWNDSPTGSTTGQSQPGAMMCYSNTVARTDTAAKNLFVIPANLVITQLKYFSPTASNAGTTATLSVGKTGSNTFFLNAADVKTAATGAGQVVPNAAANLGAIGAADLQVVGIYAETGGASNAGGPWTVTLEGYVP